MEKGKLGLFMILQLITKVLFAQGISISPSRVFFEGAPGQVLKEKLFISNTSEKEYLFQINFKDWKRDSLGNKVFGNPPQNGGSNASWIELAEGKTIKIGPKEKKEVSLIMHVPDLQSKELTNSMLFFTQFVPQSDSLSHTSKMGIRQLFEFGIHLYHTPLGAGEPNISYTGFHNAELSGHAGEKKRQIGLKLKNTGPRVDDAKILLELTNKATGEEHRFNPVAISLMPGEEQWVFFLVSEKLRGKYLATSIAQLVGTSKRRIAEKDLEFD